MPTWRSASQISPGFRACLRGHHSMNISDIRWRTYRLPFLRGFATAHGVLTVREGIIVQVTNERGVAGYGEIAPLPAFATASLADASALLPALAAPLVNSSLHAALDLVSRPAKADLMAASVLCGLEIALLDALGKARGCGVSTLLSAAASAPRAAVAANAVVSARETQAAAAAARAARVKGFGCVKLKVGLGLSTGEEIERVAAVRAAIGPAMQLRLDANEAWQFEEAGAILCGCAPYDIQFVEQPLQAGDLAGMRALRQKMPIPLAVDEALRGPASAELILASQAADIFVIKPQSAGGLTVAQRMIATAAAQGVSSVITSTLEAGIGVAAALHLAAATPVVTLECGLATLELLVDDLLKEPLVARDGLLAVPAGPGLGVEPDPHAMDRYCGGGFT